MERVLVIAILSVASVFVGLTAFMVAARIVGAVVDVRRRRRRAVLEPPLVREVGVEGRSPEEIIRPLLRFGDRRILLAVLLDNIQVVRGLAQERLCGALEAFGFVDEWMEGLRSARWWKRADSAENLGIARSPRCVEGLVPLLDDPVPEVRLRAARALGAIRGKTAIRPLVAALDRPDRWSTIRVADILAAAGKDAAEELVDAWDELSSASRIAALDILGQVKELSVTPFLRRQLAEADDPDVRARAAHALGIIADPSSRDALVRALGDSRWPVRAMAAKALGRIGRKDAVKALAAALADRAWWVRANSAEALRALGEEGLEALRATLDSEDRYARHQAVMVLQDAGVVDRMADALADPSPGERERARDFLRRILDEGHGDLLRDLAESHPRPEVRRAMARLMEPRPGAGGGA